MSLLLLLLLLFISFRGSKVVEPRGGDGLVVVLGEDTTLRVEGAPLFAVALDAHLTRREEFLGFRVCLEVTIPVLRLEIFSLDENLSFDEGEVVA